MNMEYLNPNKNINEEELKTKLKELYPTIDDEFIINQGFLNEDVKSKLMIYNQKNKFDN